MRRLDDLSFRSPGYPIYKIFITPHREFREIKEVTEQDIEEWKKTLRKLREFIKICWSRVSKEKIASVNDKIALIADLISIFLKVPMNREILPQIAPNPMKIYMALRLLCVHERTRKEIEKILRDTLSLHRWEYKEFTEALKTFLSSDTMQILDGKETVEIVERVWNTLPADTRPAFNASSLIAHLLLSSALAWSISVNRGLTRHAQLIRLAAILHDMGKPFDYERHYEVGADIARFLLEDVLSESEINRIVQFVREHHIKGDTAEAEVLREADAKASAIDRLAAIVKPIEKKAWRMAKAINLSVPAEYKDTSWDFWRSIYAARDKLKELGLTSDDPIKELSLRFLEEIRGSSQPKKEAKGKVIEGIRIFLYDIGGIQNYIMRANKLHNLVASSIHIDTVVMASIPLLSQVKAKDKKNLWIPYEAFIYTAGGIDLLIAPRILKDCLEEVKNDLSKGDIRVRLASTPLSTFYLHTSLNLSKRMTAEKFIIRPIKGEIRDIYGDKGVYNLCELCYLNPEPTEEIENRRVCKECYELYVAGSKYHFPKRWGAKLFEGQYSPEDAFGIKWKDASNVIMEIIAGHSREEIYKLETGNIARRNIALIKIDGNLMGEFMASSLSISDVLERSFRVDSALKKAYEKALNSLFKGVKKASEGDEGEPEAARAELTIKLGTLYMGGDDALIIAPSWAALPLSLVIGREFFENLGCVKSLSIGVVSASPLHDIWLLIDAANKLLEKAKEEGRRGGMGTICFDVTDSGLMTSHTVDERFNSLKTRKLSHQPLQIDSTKDDYTLNGLLIKLLGSYSEYADLFKQAYKASRSPDEVLNRRLKNIRAAINEVYMASEGIIKGKYSLVINLSGLYAARQEARKHEDEEATLPYRIIWWALGDILSNGSSLLSDVDRAARMLSGGV